MGFGQSVTDWRHDTDGAADGRGTTAEYSASVTSELLRERERGTEREEQRERESRFYFDEGH